MSEPVINLDILNEYTDGDPEAVQEIVEIFYDTFESGLSELEKDLSHEKLEHWVAVSHKLKGAAGYVGAEKLRTLCAESQDLQDGSIETKEKIFANINSHYKVVKEHLKKHS